MHIIDDTRARHIFSGKPGHIPDTPDNRRLLEDVANDPQAWVPMTGMGTHGTRVSMPMAVRYGRKFEVNALSTVEEITFHDSWIRLQGCWRRQKNSGGRIMEMISEEQAYQAMFRFLEKYYELTQADDIGDLLGGMNREMFKDGYPADPAIWDDWKTAVREVLAASRPAN
ncbi:MAG TPA: hypothetical protein VFX55_11525 [Duganella sp.]|nr:hypothetical protein [Duganella sp.]